MVCNLEEQIDKDNYYAQEKSYVGMDKLLKEFNGEGKYFRQENQEKLLGY